MGIFADGVKFVRSKFFDKTVLNETVTGNAIAELYEAINLLAPQLQYEATLQAMSSDRDPIGDGNYPVYLEHIIYGKILDAEIISVAGFVNERIDLSEKDNGKIIVTGDAVRPNVSCIARVSYSRTYEIPKL